MNNRKLTKKLTLFALTWPIFVEISLHMLMGNADTLMLSQYSDKSVAAVGVSNQILNMIVVMFGFVATGTSIIVAQYLGANKEKEAGEVVVVSIAANVIFSISLSILLFIYGEHFLRWINAPEELKSEALIYIQIVGGLSFFTALIMTIGAGLKSYGFTKDAMYVTIGMNVLNVIGNYLFIFGPFGIPVLGVQGVAISTAVSRAVGLLVIFLLLIRRIEKPLPFQLMFTYQKEHLAKLLRVGIPSAGENLVYNTSQIIILYYVALLGTEMLTTRIYTSNIMMFIVVFAIAIGQGTQILIGHKVGARENDEAYRICIRSLKLAVLISFSMATISYFFSEQLFGMFTDNQEIISMGSILIMLCIILEPGRCLNIVIINALRAAGDVKFPVFMGIASMLVISVPIAYVLGIHYGLGLVGIWLAFILDEWLRGLLMLWRWRSRVWENMSFVPRNERKSEAETLSSY